MGNERRTFRGKLDEEVRVPGFASLTKEQLESHLARSRYGDFELTDAIRLCPGIVPIEGFRIDSYKTEEPPHITIPVIVATVTRQKLLDVFMDLTDTLGPEVDMVLETSHGQQRNMHRDLYREHIDLAVLQSAIWEYHDLLLNDGCTGIAILNPSSSKEIHLDDHKLITGYSPSFSEFEAILTHHRIAHLQNMRIVTDGPHVHSSSDAQEQQFRELAGRLNIDDETQEEFPV